MFFPGHVGVSGRYPFNCEGVLADTPSQVRMCTHGTRISDYDKILISF